MKPDDHQSWLKRQFKSSSTPNLGQWNRSKCNQSVYTATEMILILHVMNLACFEVLGYKLIHYLICPQHVKGLWSKSQSRLD